LGVVALQTDAVLAVPDAVSRDGRVMTGHVAVLLADKYAAGLLADKYAVVLLVDKYAGLSGHART
jgi:hypothetical protein